MGFPDTTATSEFKISLSKRFLHFFDLIKVLSKKEMKVRYKNNILGYFWSVGHPLAFAFVFYVCFKMVLKIPKENYQIFLIAGLFPWQWFNNTVAASPMAFIGNSSIIKKVSFPRSAVVISTVIHDMIHFVFSIPIIVLFMLFAGLHPTWQWLVGIPVLLAFQFLIIYGISIAMASVNLFFRDLERLISIFMTFLFYFTPILYSVDMIPERYQQLVVLNPVALLMIAWRTLFLDGVMLWSSAAISGLYAIVFVMAGHFLVYRKLSWRFAELI